MLFSSVRSHVGVVVDGIEGEWKWSGMTESNARVLFLPAEFAHVPVEDLDTEEEDERGSEGLESGSWKPEKKIELFSIASSTVIALGCIGMIEYSMILPSLSEYVETLGENAEFYGVCQAMFSLSRILMMPIMGRWCDARPMFEPFLFSIALQIVGNLMYASAYGLGSSWIILVARMLVGCGAANATLTMSFIARITRSEERTKAMAMLSGINLIGVVIGPAVNLLVTEINFEIPGTIIIFNPLTNPGWLMVLLMLVLAGVLWLTFEEPPPPEETVTEPLLDEFDEESEYSSPYHYSNGSGGNRRRSLSRANSVFSVMSDDLQEPTWDTAGLSREAKKPGFSIIAIMKSIIEKELWVHFVVSFAANFMLNELETALPALTRMEYGWNAVDNSVLYACVGSCAAVTLVTIVKFSHRIADRVFIGIGHVLFIISLVFAIWRLRVHPVKWEFIFAVIVLTCTSPIVGSPNMSLFSKRLQQDAALIRNLGIFVGLLQAANGLSRIAGPIYAGFGLMNEKDHLSLFTMPLVITCISFILFLRFFHTMNV